jgi:predicted aspartyl protease
LAAAVCTRNGERIERDVGVVVFRWNGSEGASEVVFGEKGDKPLLGALTLESLALKVNPRKGRLEPTELMLLRAIR